MTALTRLPLPMAHHQPEAKMSINLNAASARELTQLPRIGADKARKIVRYREVRKGFRDWDDVGRTPGITSADVEAIRTRAWLGPPKTRGWIGTDRRRTGRGPGGQAASPAGFWRRASGARGRRQEE